MRDALERAAGHATDLAEAAHRRNDKTTTSRAIDIIEALTDALRALTAEMTDLRDEITNHTNERPNQ
jgi:DNA-directed RNA polymerase subunit L